MSKLNLIYFVLLLFRFVICHLFEPLVETKAGIIKGVPSENGNFFMFLGIPYAQVNSSNPFGVSIPYPPFKNTFEAYDDSVFCPQVNEYYNNYTIMGSLDCLRLNVYVTPYSGSVSTPVMIWLYGGGFRFGQFGRNYYGPEFLVQHDVIVVTLNYRTGPYGFMCLDIPEVPGNQGLRDQYLAIKWVKENIKAFGGDPNQITLFGQSAGAHSIDLHLMSTTETLFNKVILQSGSAQSLTMQYEPDKTSVLKIAKYLGFHSNNTRKALYYISKANTDTVIAAATNLKIQFKPCVEHHFEDVEPFLRKPWVSMESEKVKNMPVMMGFNYLETAIDILPKTDNYYNIITTINDKMKQIFDFTDSEQEKIVNTVYNFYFDDNEMSKKVKMGLIRFTSDITYIHPVYRTLQKYLEYGAANIYFYMFSYVGERNKISTAFRDDSGWIIHHSCCASHADDVAYIFNTPNFPEVNDDDSIFMKRMTTLWTNFAKYSDPTPEFSQILPVKWKPVTLKDYYYLNLDKSLTLGKRPLHEQMAFWDLLFSDYMNFFKNYTSFS